MQKITPFLWFDRNAEEAVNFYTSIFMDSKIGKIVRFPPGSPGGKEGDVMTIEFMLGGQKFTALNGGPVYQFNPAISLVINCINQAEVDYYWEHLAAGGQEVQCGWLTDRYGISWQVVPTVLMEMFSDKDPAKVDRVNQAMLKMIKLDVAGLKKAYEGK